MMYAFIPFFEKIFVFILVLGPLIFVHELGHFLFAKLFRVRVLKFSLGFGNKLLATQWGETEYVLSALPFGGYVKMFGEQPDQEVAEEERSRSFSHKPVWQRFVIVAGGPLFNILFAFLLLWSIFAVKGIPEVVDNTIIGEVSAASAAQRAGLQVDDLIIAINEDKVNSWQQVSELIKESGGRELTLVVERQGERMTITAVPTMEKVKNVFEQAVGERYLLGIAMKRIDRYEPASLGQALVAAYEGTKKTIEFTYEIIVKMIQRVIPANQIGGPISIAQIADQHLKRGVLDLLYLVVSLSINLGILNLLPIPILDGGHLVFFAIEGVVRRPLNERIMELCQRLGIVLLASLMLFAFYNDIVKVVRQWTGHP